MIQQSKQTQEDLNKVEPNQSGDVAKQFELHKEVRRKFIGRCFLCNGIFHLKKDYTDKYAKPISCYCYNCYAYRHRDSEYRRPGSNSNMYQGTNHVTSRPNGTINVIENGVMCYKCNNFTYIARDCRLKISQSHLEYYMLTYLVVKSLKKKMKDMLKGF